MRRPPGWVVKAVPVLAFAALAPRVGLGFLVLLYSPGVMVSALAGYRGTSFSNPAVSLVAGMASLSILVYASAFVPPLVFSFLAAAYLFLSILGLVRLGRLWYRRVVSGEEAGNATVAISAVVAAGVLARLLPMASMNAPLFADPAVEGNLARLIATNFGLPAGWEPFAPMALNHQPGYAGITAAIHMISGVEIPRVILLFSGMIHALFPFSVYVLAKTVLEKKEEAVLAAFIALMSSFPLYSFVAGMNSANLGLFMAPVTAALSIDYIRNPGNAKVPFLMVVGLGAMLVHPIGVFVVGLLVLPGALRRFYQALEEGWREVFPVAEMGAAVFLLPLLASLPQYLPILLEGGASGQFAIQSNYILPGGDLSLFHLLEPFYVNFMNWSGGWYVPADRALFAFLSNPLATVMVAAAAVSLYSAFYNVDRATLTSAAWYVLFLLFSTVQAALRVPFPGHSFIYPTRIKFMFAVPIALLSARGLKEISVRFRGRNLYPLLMALLILSPVGLLSTYQYIEGLSSDPVVSDSDLRAIRWVEKNVGEDEVILNTVTDVEAGAFIGGPGQWIPAYTGNRVVFPATSITGDVRSMQDRMRLMESLREGQEGGFRNLLDEHNVSYVFLSENKMDGRGEENPPPPESVKKMCNCSTVYDNEDATILEVPRGLSS
ncbi:MAG: DUF6541 family protein [Candidatus Nanohaloarchaea archaeon]